MTCALPKRTKKSGCTMMIQTVKEMKDLVARP
jgi:hypothetical protein